MQRNAEYNPIPAIRKFVEIWKGRGYEKGDTQTFWYQLLHDVFCIDTPATFISFEKRVDGTFSDGYIPSTKVIIEQKSLGIDLSKPEKQSDGTMLTPYQQALRYSQRLKFSQRARWIVVSDFKTFHIHDMENPTDDPLVIELKDLEKQFYLLSFLVQDIEGKLHKQRELSVKAGELIAKLYDALKSQFKDTTDSYNIRSLNTLCVRLMFCLFAEDSSLFGYVPGRFYNYLSSYKPSQMRSALISLFHVLNTPLDARDPYLDEDLKAFPYVNGGLFNDEEYIIPQLNGEISDILLEQCSRGFKWADISPTIFGAIVEDTMNPETRDINCPHYTSIENIHKVIDALFLNELKADLASIIKIAEDRERTKELITFQDKLSHIKILDPACGSGNFLTESYLSLRKLENQVLQILFHTNGVKYPDLKPKIEISNFYGLEINDFAVSVSKAALWIAEAQCLIETENLLNKKFEFLPLTSLSNIHEVNALRIDWDSIVNPGELNYIVGNPPFVGKKSLSGRQRDDLLYVADKVVTSRAGNLDYVAAWFIKCSQFIQKTEIKCALVSTVNVTRGEQVNILWQTLFSKYHINIVFAYQAFKWYNEARKQVQVHCTVVGFCDRKQKGKKFIVDSNGKVNVVSQINPYLREGRTQFVKSRKHPVCDVPLQKIGNKPIDGGNYVFSRNEMESFLETEPQAKPFFKPFIGAEQWIDRKERFILWLDGVSPSVLKHLPKCRQRIESVRRYRLSLGGQSAKLADYPTKMHVTNVPTSDFIVIPEVSSEKRYYIPMDFVEYDADNNPIYSNLVKITSPATPYHFGIMQSRVHMVWTKAFCGYKDIRPRYSTEVVYNNFPWPDPTDEIKEKITKAAIRVLDIRRKYSDCTIAELYDDTLMPSDLRKAHKDLDRLVIKSFGMSIESSDDEILDFLCREYDRIADSKS